VASAVKNSGSNTGNSSVVQIRVADGSILSKKAVGDAKLGVADMAVRITGRDTVSGKGAGK
jgi:hypothetical protein